MGHQHYVTRHNVSKECNQSPVLFSQRTFKSFCLLKTGILITQSLLEPWTCKLRNDAVQLQMVVLLFLHHIILIWLSMLRLAFFWGGGGRICTPIAGGSFIYIFTNFIYSFVFSLFIYLFFILFFLGGGGGGGGGGGRKMFTLTNDGGGPLSIFAKTFFLKGG